MSEEISEKIEDIQNKIRKHQEEIDKLREETFGLKKQKNIDNILFQFQVVKDLFTVFNLDPEKINFFQDDFIEFELTEFKMKIQIVPTDDYIEIYYEPILNFDGGVDPEGMNEFLEFSEASVYNVLEAINIMQINYLKSKLEETFFVEKNINKIEDMMESLKEKK